MSRKSRSVMTADQRTANSLRKLSEIADLYRAHIAEGHLDPAAQIATARGVSPSTARSWIHRARLAGFLGEALERTAGEMRNGVAVFPPRKPVKLDQAIIDDYEARFREYEDKVCSLAADLMDVHVALGESRGASDAGLDGDVALVIQQRNAAREALERVTGERDGARHRIEYLDACFHRAMDGLDGATKRSVQHQIERDELRAEVVRLGRKYQKIISLGAAWLAEGFPVTGATAEHALADAFERPQTLAGGLGAAEAAEPPEPSVEDWDWQPPSFSRDEVSSASDRLRTALDGEET